MVNKLLLSTKIEDQYHYNFEAVLLKPFVTQIIQYYPFPNKEHRVNFSCPEGLKAQIDKETFKSVVTNLIENAIKYSEHPAFIDIKLVDELNTFTMKCKDIGLGIKDNEKQLVLDKFYRVGDEEYRSTTGSGLGLFIVHSIVSAHQGSITISDNKPKGTIVSIQIPKTQKP